MQALNIPPPPPPEVSDLPDRDTKKGLADFSNDPSAEGRVLHINNRFFRYGTDDKAHAASIVLSLILLLCLMVVVIMGVLATSKDFWDRCIEILSQAFTFTAGVAIGRGGSQKAE